MRALLVLVAAVAGLAAPAAAVAAAPENDAPAGAAGFAPATAANGMPDERSAVASLAEATPDAGVPSCLGDGSFARTVWFRIPVADAPRELQVEAVGRTTGVLDLALFVQPATGAQTGEPNACAGVGSGAADASEEPTAGIVVRVPAGRSVLVQVGRRGPAGSADDERALVTLAERALPAGAPPGDAADDATPAIAPGRPAVAPLGGATTSEEDPAQPVCPSLGGVWRRHVPEAAGPLTFVAAGTQVGTLTVFRGARPTAGGVVGCENRVRANGDLRLVVPGARAGEPLWVRLGTDRPPAEATGTIRVVRGARAPVACAAPVGLRSLAVRPAGAGRLRIGFTRTASAPVTVDVFQQSAGRRVTGERLVARFARRARGFTWNGRANRRGRRVVDGVYFVRVRVARPGGGTDVRRVVLSRSRGRFSLRAGFFRADGCDLVRTFKLTRPVFGGPADRAVGVSYRLAAAARVTVEVLRRGRVVRRLAARTDRAGRTYRLRFAAEGRARGEYTFRITARAGGRTVRAQLVSRRL